MSLKICYLDDENDLLEMFVDTFSGDGREIVTYNLPESAIEGIRKNPPDVLFIDYRLPKYTGDQIALMLDPKIPKFLITGDIQVKSNYNFEAILEKPYKIEVIEGYLKSFSDKKARGLL